MEILSLQCLGQPTMTDWPAPRCLELPACFKLFLVFAAVRCNLASSFRMAPKSIFLRFDSRMAGLFWAGDRLAPGITDALQGAHPLCHVYGCFLQRHWMPCSASLQLCRPAWHSTPFCSWSKQKRTKTIRPNGHTSRYLA